MNRAGERILGCVRNSDTVARLGGDEFVVLIDDDTLREHADQIAQRIAESFDKPFTIEGQELFIRPSVGLAVAGPGEPAVTAEDLVKRADTAMYAAKKTRTPGVQRYTHELHLDTSADNGLIQRLHSAPSPEDAASKQLLGELREAIDSVELTLAYQPSSTSSPAAWWASKLDPLAAPPPRPAQSGRIPAFGSTPRPDAPGHRSGDQHRARRRTRVASGGSASAGGRQHVGTAAGRSPPPAARIRRSLADRDLPASALTVEITEDLVLGNMEAPAMS